MSAGVAAVATGMVVGALVLISVHLSSIASSLRSIELDLAAIRRKHGL